MAGLFSSMFTTGNKVINLDSQSFEEQFKNDNNAVLIDVRTKAENTDERIPNSKLIDIMDPQFNEKIEALDKSKSYFLYCRSGNRSYHAGRAMVNKGFEKVYNLADGIIGWHGEVESGY
ncbi:MAG: rhodanese-like domain-containing protein [Melioribacteraceae bacterium]|nr:rhodanese-like domain-containing protein [Melioribacteraceae bacterium]MCF8395114.1 rhodanese-like domain-containing protein [Melioribacteraceae bacterium]MCF8420523.1 rhodanese-like domain-containing protein [Melioribacteraceae bacterium]